MSYHEYKGILFPVIVPEEALDVMPDYPVRDDDIFILTYPKSGTNWIMEVVKKVMNAAGKMATPDEHSTWCIEMYVPGKDEKPRHVLAMDSPSPRIIHTHLPRQLAPKMVANPEGKVRVIVVVRNPRDVAVSLYHYNKQMEMEFGTHVKSVNSWDAFSTDFLEGKVVYGDFYDHALGWWKMKDDSHFLFLKYEDMKKVKLERSHSLFSQDLRSVVSDVAAFLNTSLDQGTVDSIAESCTFNSLKAAWGNSDDATKKHICRKGVVGDWKSMFTPEQNAAYDAKHELRLEGTGLQFDFE
ncbi:amine sulfotransferase-like [Branchiostoma floridae]|uniref:Sulfotransferase n=1 Tax=Branchiostoma floridae TaxID=7739 RepID=A0A9J7NDT6_BRAFL|nr:amine sulfotransferase-like [Branchiostoma floridae]